MRELALHILDVARNSVEAGSSRVEIEVVEAAAEDQLRVTISDNGPGIAPERLPHVTDPFHTTRTTRRWGLGLSLFQAACERCEGRLEVSSAPGLGTTVRARLSLDHIDRAPLGNMGSVVQTLAAEARQVVLRYRHQAPGGVFELDTEEVQTELGDVPITEPTVLHWLGGHVNEELRTIRSEA